MDPKYHYKIGQILQKYKDENVLIITSGASTHSFTYMNSKGFTEQSIKWEKWLEEKIT